MANWQGRLLLVGSALILLTALTSKLSYTNFNNGFIIFALLQAISSLVCFILSLVMFHISYEKPASSHTFASLVKTYIINYVVPATLGRFYQQQLLATMQDPQTHQDKLLIDILHTNGQTAFSKDHGLDKIQSVDEFMEKFPLTDYTFYEKYVERVLKGEKNVLTKADVKFVTTSSGTTGKSKKYVTTFSTKLEKAILVLYRSWSQLRTDKMGRQYSLKLCSQIQRSEAGIGIGALSMARPYRSPSDVTPPAVMSIFKEAPSYLVQGVFCLREPEIILIQGYSSDLVYAFFKFLEHYKEEMCKAIASGHIGAFPELDETLRKETNHLLTPDPDRAKEVHLQLTKGSYALAKRLWPKLKIVFMGKTGSFFHAAKLLQESYFHGLEIGLGIHGGTEGISNIAMTPEDIMKEEYTFLPTSAFFEFIPIGDIEKENPKTLKMNQIEVGKEYELLVTNYDGHYRNRFGDVIKIVGFTGKSPKYTFQYRTGQILNCGFDRTPEKLFYKAVRLAEEQLKDVTTIDNYTATESIHMESVTGIGYPKRHYIVFIETGTDIILSTENCQKFDSSLCQLHTAYAAPRGRGSIGPMEVIQVRAGTFDGLRQVLWGDSQNYQFKMPRVMRKPEALTFLWNNRISAEQI